MLRRRLLLLLLIAVAAGWIEHFAVYQVDDAYIVYRYAENLARGEGFVFNPGERVEGVTCFLWTLALAPFAAAGLALPRVAPLLTGLAGLATLLLLPAVAARLDGRARSDAGDLAAPALLAVLPGFAIWSAGALETVPYALLVTAALRLHLRERARGGFAGSGIAMGLAALVRPEAPLLAAALALDRLLARGRDGRPHWAAAAGMLGLVLLAAAGITAFRRLYFDAWLPNTYDAKTGAGLGFQLENGARYTRSFLSALLSASAPPPDRTLLGAALAGTLLVAGLVAPARRPAALLLLALAVAVLLEGGDWMTSYRFFVPGLAPAAALWTAVGRAGFRRHRALGAALAAASIAAAAAWVAQALETRDGGTGLAVNAEGYRRAHLEVARWLGENARPGEAVALMDVGMIGWANPRLRMVDISGLTDREIARAPGGFLEKRYPPELILARDPRFFVLVPGFPIDTAIALHPDFERRYRHVLQRDHRFNWSPPSSYVLHLYERRAPDRTGAPASSGSQSSAGPGARDRSIASRRAFSARPPP
jgi:hypothetical protein